MLKTRIIPSKPIMVLEGKKKNLIVTDIHIGFESTLASNEIFIGKNTSINETIEELSSVIDSEKPDSLILLGDIKSSIKNISKSEWDEVPLFFNRIKQKCDIILIPGNHDANIQRLVQLEWLRKISYLHMGIQCPQKIILMLIKSSWVMYILYFFKKIQY